MDYIEAWRTKLEPIMSRRGRNAELARWLVDRIGGEFAHRKTQISRIFGRRQMVPQAEFVLAVEDWIKERNFDEKGLARPR